MNALSFAWAKQILNNCPDKTLIIIDMQDYFLYRKEEKELIPIVCELIQYAKQKKWAIILVEYSGQGSTTDAIMEALKDYLRQATVIKTDNNGGQEIIECLDNQKTWSLNLLICGIYSPQCVAETVGGLFDYSDLIEVGVITDAISPPYCSSSEPDEYGQQQEREVTTKEIGIAAKYLCNLG